MEAKYKSDTGARNSERKIIHQVEEIMAKNQEQAKSFLQKSNWVNLIINWM